MFKRGGNKKLRKTAKTSLRWRAGLSLFTVRCPGWVSAGWSASLPA